MKIMNSLIGNVKRKVRNEKKTRFVQLINTRSAQRKMDENL